MNKQNTLVFRLELIWWVVTAIIIGTVLFPVYKVQPEYPFWTINIISIVTFITLTRYVFLLKYTFLGYIQWAKAVALFLCIPLIIYLISELHAFQLYLDEVGLEGIFSHLSPPDIKGMVKYVSSEMLFFTVGSIIATIIFPFRMLISFWRTHNHGTV